MGPMSAVKHHIRGTELLLLPEKAIYWPEKDALLVADLHLGKITHFRKAGIGLPQEVETENLERLSQLIIDHKVKTLYILGDLFHSHMNTQWAKFKSFMASFPQIQFVLIRGNHDILDEKNYQAANLKYYPDRLILEPFILTHIPLEAASKYYNICGHIHPGVRLRGKGLQAIKLPCFHFRADRLVLPAFGAFTGTARIEPQEEDCIFAIAEDKVVRVS